MDVKQKNVARINMYTTLVLYALIPLVTGAIFITSLLYYKAKSEIIDITGNYIYTMALSEGEGLDDYIKLMGVEEALAFDTIDQYCSDIVIEEMSSSYCYLLDTNGIMLWHPTKDKIGAEVSNDVLKKVCADLSSGKNVHSDFVSYIYKGETKYAGYYVSDYKDFVLVITADAADLNVRTNALLYYGISIALLLVLVFVVIAILVAKIIATPLKEIAGDLQVLATGDLNVTFNSKSHEKEIVSIIESANILVDSLKKSIGTVQDDSIKLEEAIEGVDEKIEFNANSVNQINSAIGEVSDTSQNVASSAQNIAEKSDLLGQNIDSLVSNVKNLKVASDKISQVNKEATQKMDTVLNSSSESVKAVTNISDKINETNEAVATINECIEMIEDISSQTNLLSLNASIEAARAEEIKKTIDRVVQISEETVEEAKNVFAIIEEEQKYIKDTQEKFNILSESVGESTQAIDNVSGMTVQLDNIKQEINGAINDLSAISQELGASAQEVSATCQTVADACAETAEKTKDMAHIGESLKEAVSVFKI